MLAALNTTEQLLLMQKNLVIIQVTTKMLKLPIKIKKDNKKDFIAINGKKH